MYKKTKVIDHIYGTSDTGENLTTSKRLDKIESILLQIITRLDKIDDFIVKQEHFNQFVLDMFKKHKWIK